MTPMALTLMIVSIGFVTGLLIWCYRKILSAPPPAHEFEDFHSA